jgi:hypothetical protein
MTEDAPPGKAKGSNSGKSVEALKANQIHHHEDSVSSEVVEHPDNIKARSGTSRENLPARLKARIAAERSVPKMHWHWRRRGRDILALLQSRFGSVLPDDDAGMDAVNLLAQHYMRLHIDAERVTKANLRHWASWLTEKAFAGIINGAKKAKTPSAEQLGKDFRVTVGEAADLELSTIVAFTITPEGNRVRQARRRRNAGATGKRGRPSLGLSDSEKRARTNTQAAERMRKLRALRKNSHAVAYIRGTKRDEFSVTLAALDFAGINFARFGITAIRIMHGQTVVRAWEHAPMLARAALGAPKHRG